MRIHSLAIAAVLALACTSHEGVGGNDPETALPAVQLRATIASAQLLEDCPDAQAAQARSSEYAKEAHPSPRTCTQSTMQLSLAHDGSDPQRVEIAAIRLLTADGKDTLATLSSREPSKWSDAGGYGAWDERVPVGAEIKVSYEITPPNWAQVQQKLGRGRGDTFDERYIVEVDVKMGGKITTVRSAELGREHEEVMVT
ncbi:MAG TPA: hypothetical protein VFG69_19390 [Nannocystaceae bacterium]|nr:hypothetical protein [Nannocystaceae bacterium]